jgi:hypothetical protein
MREGEDKGGRKEHKKHVSLTKPVEIKCNKQPMMKDRGHNANALSGSGGCNGVAVAVARRVAKAVLREVVVAVAVAKAIEMTWQWQ